jgi:predicted nucleotidyltransferase
MPSDGKGAEALKRLLARASEDPAVLAVLLFGSAARGEETETSDVDVCVALRPGCYRDEEISHRRLDYMALGALDLHIFQQLPLYLRRRVLKEGKVLYVRDEDALYELASRTARAFEHYKHIYRQYLEEIASG